ncbi:unnamed protein product (macronuclear) [Paramecium tetraurelia]|uniref:Uncharacterized protein n=1 Tax=Paramecium tetraurelia TaxID=5888 RepID=A0E5C3_PARTE|nr:uncharacterized protein GSPATT00023667001 [Paramecium tetraurelia]CAK90490.1 unnamed protein product [Paramecium tetraurelia]|eukprot:XP_001457887.1 hypothetical protein (macronuclear) [Paramecium tetraurelia strain d4-2]
MLNQKCFMVNLLQSMILSYSIYHQLESSCLLNLIQLIIITSITLALILLQNVFNKFMLQGTIICIQLDMICLIIMNVHNFGRIPFSQIIMAQILIKDLYLEFKLRLQSQLLALQAIISIFLLVYSYVRIEFDREQPQLLISLMISIYFNSSLMKQKPSQITSILTEITNTNKQEMLNSKRGVSQFDLDQNPNSAGIRDTSALADNGISDSTIQCLELLKEGVILLVPDSNSSNFPYIIKYLNQATKTLFNRESEQEVLQFIDSLNTFQLVNGEANDDLLFVSQIQRQPSLYLFKQTTEIKDQTYLQQRNLSLDVSQGQEKSQKYKIKYIIDMLLKQKNQDCIVVQTQLNLRQTVFTNQQIQVSQTYINADNNQLLELTLTLSKNQNIIIICRDVTHRQKIRYLKEYDKQKSKMLSFVSHEYRSPLNCIIQMLEQVLKQTQIKNNPQINEQLQIALDNSNYILNLSNDLLDLAQIKNGKFKVEKVPFNLSTLIEECQKMFELKAKLRQVQLSTNYSSSLPQFIFQDRNRLKQIIVNLLSNAFKFTQSGKIKIMLEMVKSKNLRIGVRDEGIGISEEDQLNLFKAFSKVNSEESRKLNQQGVGLGLVISNQIVQNIGSAGLNIDSKNEKNNHYCHFYFDLLIDDFFKKKVSSFRIPEISLQPQEVDEINSFQKIPSNTKEDLSTQQICLHYLIVDDDCFNTFAFKGILQEFEFDVDQALSGSESIKKIQNKKCCSTCSGYKIVFMDIEMPQMNGQQTTKIILKSFPNQIIIGCSGYTDQQEYEKCINSGMADFLVKPIKESYINDIYSIYFCFFILIITAIILKIHYYVFVKFNILVNRIFELINMDKLPIGYVKGKGNPLDKKVPKNKQYDHVKQTLNTGPTVRDIEVVSNAKIAKKRSELFKRIKCSTVFNFISENTEQETIYKLADQQQQAQEQLQQFDTQSQHSQMTRFTEVSQVSAITYATEQLGITDQSEFLLLDLRDADEFELYHIKEAVNFPAPNLRQDKLTQQIHRFKNQKDKHIIIYHFDEKNGIPSATLFAEKGFENVYLLSGGIEKFLQNYPQGVIGIKVPSIPKPEENPNKIIKRSNYKEADSQINKSEKNISDTKSQISQKTKITRQSSQQKQQQSQYIDK